MLSIFTFEEQPGGKTKFTIRWSPHNATEEERKTFDAGHDSMQQGWTGTLDQLEAYLAQGAKGLSGWMQPVARFGRELHDSPRAALNGGTRWLTSMDLSCRCRRRSLKAYRSMAKKAGKVWREHGALEYPNASPTTSRSASGRRSRAA